MKTIVRIIIIKLTRAIVVKVRIEKNIDITTNDDHNDNDRNSIPLSSRNLAGIRNALWLCALKESGLSFRRSFGKD